MNYRWMLPDPDILQETKAGRVDLRIYEARYDWLRAWLIEQDERLKKLEELLKPTEHVRQCECLVVDRRSGKDRRGPQPLAGPGKYLKNDRRSSRGRRTGD